MSEPILTLQGMWMGGVQGSCLPLATCASMRRHQQVRYIQSCHLLSFFSCILCLPLAPLYFVWKPQVLYDVQRLGKTQSQRLLKYQLQANSIAFIFSIMFWNVLTMATINTKSESQIFSISTQSTPLQVSNSKFYALVNKQKDLQRNFPGYPAKFHWIIASWAPNRVEQAASG